MTRRLLLLAVVLAGCAAAPASSPSLAGRSATETTSSGGAVLRSASPEAGKPPLETMLPGELGGVELHTFAVGEDTLGRMAEHLGVGLEELEARFASDHGAQFLQMYALRAPGVGGSELVEAWATVGYPPDVTDPSISEQSVGGRSVTVRNAPSVAARLGTYYFYESDNTLIVVQAFEPEVAAEALAVLP